MGRWDWVVLLLVQLPREQCFVLQGVNSTTASSLPGTAQRWRVPASSSSTEGLGGGLSWVLDDAFCDHLMSRFPERSVVRGIDLPSLDFLQCEDIKAAILRGFSTWAENHRLVSFHDISHTASCATHSAAPDDSCPWELYVTTDDGSEYAKLAAYVFTHRDSSVDPNWFAKSVRASSGVQASGVDAHYRSVMRFQTHLCWYLDATFCYYFQRLEKEHNVDVSLVMRVVLFLLFGLAALKLLTVTLFICAAVCCLKDEDAQLVRKRRGLSARCSAALDYLSSLSPCVTVLTLFFITFPPIFYDRIFLPCWVR